jgi:hypothetical protein
MNDSNFNGFCDKINVGFYLANKNTKNVDCTDVYSGNPGVGGTLYAILLLACSLTTDCERLNVTVYADEKGSLPNLLRVKQVENFEDLVHQNLEDKSHVLVLTDGAANFDDLYSVGDQLKIVFWSHQFLHPRELRVFAKLDNVKRIVCAAQEQLDLFRDHEAFKKATAIHNAVNVGYVKECYRGGKTTTLDQNMLLT